MRAQLLRKSCGASFAIPARFAQFFTTYQTTFCVTPPRDLRTNYDPQVRLKSQFDHMVSFTQAVVRKSPARRKEFWAKANSAWPTEKELVEGHTYMSYMQPSQALVSQWASSPAQWKVAAKWHRDYIWEEVIGRLPPPSVPANPPHKLGPPTRSPCAWAEARLSKMRLKRGWHPS